MMFYIFFLLLFTSRDTLCFGESDRGNENHLGYFIKSPKQDDYERSRHNSMKVENKSEEFVTDGIVKDVPTVISKNDSALALHVTNTARQQCLDGYQADENGICQKTMQPKNDKSFKLRRRRRKRAEQTAPKLSYADVVKYGRNPPKELLTTMKPEVLTKKAPELTTMKPELLTKKAPELTTMKPQKSPQAKVPETTQLITQPFKTSVKAPATVPTTMKPAVAVTAPPVVTKPPNKPMDINQAFLSGEKSSVLAQTQNVKAKPVPAPDKKTIDPSRLRRWIGI